jgi:hypothetical protein
MRKIAVVGGLVLSGWMAGAVLSAQEPATLVLTNGQRVSGELIDLNASGFAVRVNGQDRSWGAGDVAAIEFVGGDVPADAQRHLAAGQPVIVLRSGQVVEGRLTDVGGTRPLRLTVSGPGGTHDYTSNDVARVYLSAPPGSGNADLGQPAQGDRSFTVPANRMWTDTGIRVRRGDRVQFHGTGDIKISPDASSGVGGSPNPPGGRLPLQSAAVGTLIARVGNGLPFLVASNTAPIPMPSSGVLMLGVNDDYYDDNTGNFTVEVTVLGR